MKKGETPLSNWGIGILIAVAVLILMFIISWILKDKGIGMIEYIKNLFTFEK